MDRQCRDVVRERVRQHHCVRLVRQSEASAEDIAQLVVKPHAAATEAGAGEALAIEGLQASVRAAGVQRRERLMRDLHGCGHRRARESPVGAGNLRVSRDHERLCHAEPRELLRYLREGSLAEHHPLRQRGVRGVRYSETEDARGMLLPDLGASVSESGDRRERIVCCEMKKYLALAVLVACTKPLPVRELVDELRVTAALDTAARTKVVAGWKLDHDAWVATVAEPYDGTYAEYETAFAAAAPQLAVQLAGHTDIVTRAHFAGDPLLTTNEARARWALPVQYPAQVAQLGTAQLDAVFVRTAAGWGAIVGIDAIVVAHVTRYARDCVRYVATVGVKRCEEVAWVVADAALRDDVPRLTRACSLARTACAVVQPAP